MNTADIQPTSIIHRTVDLEFTKLDEELLSLDEKRGFCYSMNGTAGIVWELISTPISVKFLCNQLQNQFNVDSEKCLLDTLQLLNKLNEADLIEVLNASSSKTLL